MNAEEYACRVLFIAVIFGAVFLSPHIALEVLEWM